MSHSKKDAVGGHASTWIDGGDGKMVNKMKGRRFGKKFHRREARREAKKVITEALMLLEADVRDALEELYWHEANSNFYDMIYEDELERERQDHIEYDEYDHYNSYYDPYYDDPFWFEMERHPEPVTQVYAAGESLGDILERIIAKKG